MKLQPMCQVCERLCVASGSILDYQGDAFVNAANEGCVGGFGVDEMVNRSGGVELRKARKELGGCPTGGAKLTSSFAHGNTQHIIHAVGPVYRIKKLKQGFDEDDRERAAAYMQSLDPLLVRAYESSLECARQAGARRVGFCLLSAGVFRGGRSLEDIIQIAIRTLACALTKTMAAEFDAVTLVAYTAEEQELAKLVAEQVKEEFARGGDGCDHELVSGLLDKGGV